MGGLFLAGLVGMLEARLLGRCMGYDSHEVKDPSFSSLREVRDIPTSSVVFV